MNICEPTMSFSSLIDREGMAKAASTLISWLLNEPCEITAGERSFEGSLVIKGAVYDLIINEKLRTIRLRDYNGVLIGCEVYDNTYQDVFARVSEYVSFNRLIKRTEP